MFNKKSDDGFVDAIPGMEGILRKTLVYGDKTLMTEFRLAGGKTLPMHAHPHEQTGYLVSGKIVLMVEDKEIETLPGDSWCIPGDVRHGAKIIEDSVAVEVFAPVREEYK